MLYEGKNKLLAMKRVKQQFSYEHYPEISDISVIDGMIDLLPGKIIKDLNLADRDILDIFEEDGIGRRFPLKINGAPPNKWTTISSTDDQIIIYKTKLGNLGLRFAIKNRLNISAISCKDSQIIFSLSHEFSINELYLSNATKNGETSDKRGIKKINFKQINNNLIFNVNEVLSNPESQFQKSFCLIYKESSGNLLRTIKYVDNVLDFSDSYIYLSVGKNFLDEAVVSIRMKQTKSPIKVAVLGSSHTRPMFTSTDYFNPDYKQFFKVVYTQFHSSIRSLVDERKIVYPKEYFEKEHPTAQGYIKTDFQKDFFDKLSESNAEVLLIDVYIDVQMGVFELSNGILSYNTYQVKNEYIAELNDEINLSTIETDVEYINIFKLSLELFKKKLLKIFSENRIIIHLVDMNYSYVSSNGEIMPYKQSTGSISTLNSNALSLNSCLMETFPKAYILDLRDSKYYGDEDMPLGNIPHHFQSGYYQEMLGEFSKIFLKMMNDNKND